MEREQHLSRSVDPVTGYRSLPLQLQNHEIPGREAIYDQEQAISDGQGSKFLDIRCVECKNGSGFMKKLLGTDQFIHPVCALSYPNVY